MRMLGVVNRWLLVRGYCRIHHVDIPAADRERLLRAVNRDTAAFLGPNHPEFGADWLVDKEVSTFVAPRMASWAARNIVNAAPRFWGMNNLVAADGGDAAKEYSIERALAGDGVLLHPEGSVRWTNDHVHPLFPGIAQMAMQAADRTERPVYIVPLVWKYRYIGDVSGRMHREMAIIERALDLPTMPGVSVAKRFHALQLNLLAARMRSFGYEDACPSASFFERQRAFQLHLVRELMSRYRVEPSESMDRTIARLKSVILSEAKDLHSSQPEAGPSLRSLRLRSGQAGRQISSPSLDLLQADEARRLGEMSADVYDTPLLTQEQISECLKRTRDRLMRRGWRNALANMLPCPLGARVVHVGVPEPICVTTVHRHERGDYEAALLELTRASMQSALDDINRRIAPAVEAFAVENPFASQSFGS